MAQENPEIIIFTVYSAIWLLAGAVSFAANRFITDITVRCRIKEIAGSIILASLLLTGNVLVYIWGLPVASRVFLNLMFAGWVVLVFRNVAYCPHCEAGVQWITHRKYCSKCGRMIVSVLNL